jgi:hypothetical protein
MLSRRSWHFGSTFRLEVGFANLTLGVPGIIATAFGRLRRSPVPRGWGTREHPLQSFAPTACIVLLIQKTLQAAKAMPASAMRVTSGSGSNRTPSEEMRM